ncbi:hypothetical protein JD844_034280 [Phrynosoma platyrhinos]|uniref:Uncharacterized protein n=1 Tax=Phrynosoma platyrhinos TaxID=52577 RepID=A0ABQ7T8Z7_PHRPL|nr:hypothetical protein JD844_034280 [Phrynosoma platyrhinos]
MVLQEEKPLRQIPILQNFFCSVHSALHGRREALVGLKCPGHSPVRPVRHAKKRLGIVTRVILALLPSRLELHCPDTNGGACVSKGSKRKQDDVSLEEQQCWVETLLQDLPDEDDPEDSTYEPTKSETDSEEYKSHNSTETDLEFEEKNGTVMLKELPTLQEAPNREDEMAIATVLEPRAENERAPGSRSLGDGSEDHAYCKWQKDAEP